LLTARSLKGHNQLKIRPLTPYLIKYWQNATWDNNGGDTTALYYKTLFGRNFGRIAIS
jgi:hypothetical protein